MKNSIKVAVVDDHVAFRKTLVYFLRTFDEVEKVIEADNGLQFIEHLNIETPDLVFMDINMPVMNGIEATMKAIQKYPNMQIIALTQYSEDEYYAEMIKAGAKGFLVKGGENTHDEIETIVENALKSRFLFF